MKIKAALGGFAPDTPPPKTPPAIPPKPRTPKPTKKTSKNPTAPTDDINNRKDTKYHIPTDVTTLPAVPNVVRTGPATKYTPALAAQVLNHISESDCAIEDAIKDSGIISPTTWFVWVQKYPDLADAYHNMMAGRARHEVERREKEWIDTIKELDGEPSEKTLRVVDVKTRALDRRCRYTQFRAQVHNPAVYAPRALLGVQALSDPAAMMAQSYQRYHKETEFSVADSNAVPTEPDNGETSQ